MAVQDVILRDPGASGGVALSATTGGPQTLDVPLLTSGETFFAPSVSYPQTLTASAIVSTTGFPDSTKPFQGAIIPIEYAPMPHISRGKPIYGTGSYSKMNDGGYGYTAVTPGAWTAANGDWVAINVGSGPSDLLVAISNDESAIGGGSYLNTSFSAYRLQVSNDSTNGSDGTWTTVVTQTANTSMTREHKFSFTGYSWVKLICDTITGGQLDELDIWDASGGTPNTYAFLGDSLTVRGTLRYTYWGGGVQPSFQENLLTDTGQYPLQLNVGFSGYSAADWATNISSALALFPDAKYWCIGIGTNDGFSMPGAIATWRTDMQTVIDAVIADGRIPILARIPWTGATGYGGGAFDTCGLAYLNENGVEWLFQQYGPALRRGPDLYKLFYDNQVAYNVVTDPHWNEDGTKAWAAAWADSLGLSTESWLQPPLLSSAATIFSPAVLGSTGATTLTAPLIASTETLYGPALANLNPLATPLIGSGETLFGPSVGFGLSASLIGSTETLYGPNLTNVNGLTAPLIGSGETFFAPSIRFGLSAPLIGSTEALFAPSVSATVVAPLIGSTSALFAPSIGFALSAPLIGPSTTLFAPSLASAIAAPQIGSTAVLYSPALSNLNTLAAPLIGSGETFFGPTLTSALTLTAPLIGSGETLYAPVVGQFTSLSAPLIGSTEALYGPTLVAGAVAIQPPLIGSTETLYGPTLGQFTALTAPLISSTETLFGPSIGFGLTAPVIGSTATLFAPSLASSVVAPLIGSASVVNPASLTNVSTLAAPVIGSGETFYSPTLTSALTITAPLIGSTTALYGPTVGQFTALAAPAIGSTATFFSPTLTSALTLTAPTIASTAALYAPSLTNVNTLTTPVIGSTAAVYGAIVTAGNLNLAAPVIGPDTQTFAPALSAGAVTLAAPVIASTSVVNPASLSKSNTITAPVIDSTETIYSPALSNVNVLRPTSIASAVQFHSPNVSALLSAAFIPSGEVVHVPALSGNANISPPLIGSTETLYGPSFAADNTITATLITSALQFHTATIVLTLQTPSIPSTSQVFSPNLTVGAGWPVATTELPLIRALELPLPETLTRIVGIHQSDVIIRSALEAGLADLRANPFLLDYVFASLPQDVLTWREYGEKSLQAAKKWFLTTHVPVSLAPRLDESKWPQITIDLLESSEVVPEATLGDVNYEPTEQNGQNWPALTPQFTPKSFNASTGVVVLGATPEAWVGRGMFLVDKQGQAHEIVESISDVSFRISVAAGVIPDLRNCVLKSRRPSWNVDVESSSFKESYRIGIHTTDVVHLTWLHAIVQFALLRYKQVLLEARGFERSTLASSQAARDQGFETENLFSRFITVSGFVRQFWPKAISPVIDGVEMDNAGSGTGFAVSGLDADVSTALVEDPADQLWMGNLDTIRTSR